ncbi:amino acid permease [Fluviicola taffensis]|uniref:Amino acid/polyamine/organocation transporter, APC superfamily n=1 Tax=Fluviicola taffensis (strain DSM 16823 / NCIMB 13979 / RW262) TaxID=755732 RepID=F2IIE4_FLUTR|nr:amino acid permease [Fluviicola taffensis]AEA44870.1 amino acid/polyamine/organocation transporter, APC superfamily [Fluviicola taffensis DSM 16823]
MKQNSLFRKKTVQDILTASEQSQADGHDTLGKHLKVRDLAAFGIAAIIGAGIFSTIGEASSNGGPAVIFLFIFTAIACGFAAFAYAEFASMVPVAGSAYTYSYVAFGEIIAWTIGWALIMEYAIGNITVAISWSDYFTGMLEGVNIHLPQWIQTDYLTAYNGYNEAEALIQGGKNFENLDASLQAAHKAWETAPTIFNFHLIFDLPALFIIVLITWLVYRGMKESRNASNVMVIIKLAIILLVIAVGIFYVDTDNWSPFAPNGVSGILKGVSAVFFAYIGFDAISTTAEECENPQRDLPRGMMWAIIICTILYVIISLILTGLVNYKVLAVGDPLAFVFREIDLKWMSGIIAVSAVIAMASVLLVFQMGQPRIWMSMSRDGLLPKKFSKVHPKYKTPSFATIVVGFVVAVPALFMNLTMVTDLCSIGTLFAFVLVCGGVLILQNRTDIPRGKFRTPYMNGKYVLPFLVAGAIILGFTQYKPELMGFLTNQSELKETKDLIVDLSEKESAQLKESIILVDKAGFSLVGSDLLAYFEQEPKIDLKTSLRGIKSSSKAEIASELDQKTKDRLIHFLEGYDEKGLKLMDSDLEKYFEQGPKISIENALKPIGVSGKRLYNSGFSHFAHKIPTWIFILFTLFITIVTIRKNLSLIPLLGLLSCLYMMSQIELRNWIAFVIWLCIGLVIYFVYSRKNSKLGLKKTSDERQ